MGLGSAGKGQRTSLGLETMGRPLILYVRSGRCQTASLDAIGQAGSELSHELCHWRSVRSSSGRSNRREREAELAMRFWFRCGHQSWMRGVVSEGNCDCESCCSPYANVSVSPRILLQSECCMFTSIVLPTSISEATLRIHLFHY